MKKLLYLAIILVALPALAQPRRVGDGARKVGAPGGTPGISVATLAPPPSVAVSRNNPALFGTEWKYRVVTVFADGSRSAASVEGLASINGGGADDLQAESIPAASNVVNWAPVAGAVRYDVYRTFCGGSNPTTTGLIATVATNELFDTGLPGDLSTPPTTGETAAAVTIPVIVTSDVQLDSDGAIVWGGTGRDAKLVRESPGVLRIEDAQGNLASLQRANEGVVMLATDQTMVGLQPAKVTGMTMNVETGGLYSISCDYIMASAGTTTGSKFDLGGGTATKTLGPYVGFAAHDSSAYRGFAAMSTWDGDGGNYFSFSNNGSPHMSVRATGGLLIATGGTVVPRFSNNTGTGVSNSGYQNSVGVSGGVVYAFGTGNTLYRFGTAWGSLGVWASAGGVVAADPTDSAKLYVSVVNGKSGLAGNMHRSTDSGATWALGTGIPASTTQVSGIYVDPATPSNVYATVSIDPVTNGALYKSTDSGATWAASHTGLPMAAVPSPSFAVAASNPEVLFAGLYTTALYKSTDGGAAWAATAATPPVGQVYAVGVDPSNADVVYVAGSTTGTLAKSTDGGATWASLTFPSSSDMISRLIVDPLDPSRVMAGYNGSTRWYASIDGGQTWTSAQAGADNGAQEWAGVSSNGRIYARVVSGASVVYYDWATNRWWQVVNDVALTLRAGSRCQLTRTQ